LQRAIHKCINRVEWHGSYICKTNSTTIAMPIVLLESVRFATYHLVSVYARDIRVQSGLRKANIGLTNKFDSQVIQAPVSVVSDSPARELG
jgi:hypothetical protein